MLDPALSRSQKLLRSNEQINKTIPAQTRSVKGLRAHPEARQIVCSSREQTICSRSEREGHTGADVMIPSLAPLGAPVFRTVDRFPVSEECNGLGDRVFELKLTAPVGP